MGTPQMVTPVELDALRISKVGAVKFLSLGDPEQNIELVQAVHDALPDARLCARLFFKPDAENKTKFSPQQFVETVLVQAIALRMAGVKDFEVHNEPNLESEGMGWNWLDGGGFAWWFMDAVHDLRNMLPDCTFGFPGLSPQPNAYAFWLLANRGIEFADWVGAHSYWQNRGSGTWCMDSEDGGMAWKMVRGIYPNAKIKVTEFSCNNPLVPDADKAAMYKEYVEKLGGVSEAHCFALSWPGRDMNNEGWVRNGVITQMPYVIGA